MDELLYLGIVQKLNKKIQELSVNPPKGEKGDKGDPGEPGRDGRDGRDGKDGADGSAGPAGRDGVDGKDGEDGENGVSVVDATVDIDMHLVFTLSDGREIDAGSIEPLFKEGTTIYNISQGGSSGGLDSNLDISNKGFTARFTAAESLSPGVVTVLNSSSKMAKTNALQEQTTRPMLGLCISTLAADDSGLFQLKGFYPISGFIPGDVLYLSETSGAITSTPPSATGSFVRVIGYCTKADEIFFDPDKTWIEVN